MTSKPEVQTTELAASPIGEVNRISVKVPPFWKENPSIWFHQIESQFVNSGITSDATKYHIVVGHIETDILSQVSDIIDSPPAEDAYLALKKRLIEVFSDSQEKKLKKLLQDIDLGDKRPSVLLKQMQDLAGPLVGTELLKSLWLQRLPSQIQAILASSDIELKKLASMADKIADVTFSSHVNSTELKYKPVDSSATQQALTDLQQQIFDLNKKVDKLFSIYSRGRSCSHSRNGRKQNDSVNRSPSRSRLCWYHVRFGEKATKCVKPCSFSSEN